MPRNWSFWRNVAIVGTVHAIVLFGLARWSGSAKKPVATDIFWMEGGEASVTTSAIAAPPASGETFQAAPPPPATEQEEIQAPPDEEPVVVPVRSELEQPSPTPLPMPSVIPTPRPAKSSTPTPKPKIEAGTNASPSTKPASKKALVAKKATPAAKSTTTPTEKKTAENEAERVPASPTPSTDASLSGDGVGAATSGLGRSGNGSAGASQFGWYSKMLHDRCYSEWDQPTSVVASGGKMSVLVRLRIEKDGIVSNFAIARPSGNVVVDESVAAVAKRVTSVDPLPSGLGSSGHYEVNINFELNREQ